MINVSLAWISVNDIGIAVREVLNQFGEFADRDGSTRSYIIRFANVVSVHRCNICIDDIIHIDEISGLLAVAVDGNIIAIEGLRDKRRNDASVVSACLPRAVHVEIAEGDGVYVIQFVIESSVVVEIEFIEPVRRGGDEWMVFIDRECGGMPIDGRTRCENDSCIILSSRFKDMQTACSINGVAFNRLANGLMDTNQGSLVKNDISSGDNFV